MTSKICKCYHCKITYIYHPSGHCSEFNSDRYCNDCYEIILNALKSIPVKVRKTILPIEKDDISIETFKQKLNALKKASPFSYWIRELRFNAPINFRYDDLYLGEDKYTLITNIDTGEELLCKEYEEYIETQELVNPIKTDRGLLDREKEEFFKKAKYRDFNSLHEIPLSNENPCTLRSIDIENNSSSDK